MRDLINYIESIRRALKDRQIMIKVVGKQEVLDFIVDLNTLEQLFEKGEDAEGKLLEDIGGSYSQLTVLIKEFEGQPTDRVTLFDTGEFYDSFEAQILSSGDIEITANTQKDEDDLEDRWGEHIIGLTEESLEELRKVVRIELDNYLRKEVFRI